MTHQRVLYRWTPTNTLVAISLGLTAIYFIVTANDDDPTPRSVAFDLGIAAALVVLAVRGARGGIVIGAGRITVRNLFRTYSRSAIEVDRFAVGEFRFLRGFDVICMFPTSGRPIRASFLSYPMEGWKPWGEARRTLDRMVPEMNAYLNDSRPND